MNSRNPPLFTVFMPVHNDEKYLSEAIDSILGQTIKDFEFLIINDGSTDKSLEIIKEYAQQDSRIRFITRENKGVVDTLNEGLEIINTEIVVRMDADDISLPDRLEKQYRFLKDHSDYSIVSCQIQNMSPDGNPEEIDPRPTEDVNLKLFLAFGCAVSGGIAMFKKSVVTNAGGFKAGIKVAEDYDIWARAISQDPSTKMHVLPEALYFYRENNEGSSLSLKKSQIELTNQIGDSYREQMLKKGWKFLTYHTHKTWFDDLSHLEDEQNFRLRTNYYIIQSWFIRDQKKHSKLKAQLNTLKLYVYTWLVNKQDMRLIRGRLQRHVVPK